MLKKRRKQTNKQKTKQGQKIIKYIYMKFAEEKKKQGLFFCKVIGYKSENQRNNRGLKFFLKNFKKKERMIVKIVKIYIGLSLVLL